MYPDRYRLPEITAHVLALLERRRPGFASLDEAAEAELTAEARRALAEAGAQFREVADDPSYWDRLEQSFFAVALPRYLRVARDRHELERRRFDLWRGGDLVSRGAYAVAGLLAALIVLRIRMPWMEIPAIALFLFGPLIPDVQVWVHDRRHRRALKSIVDDMASEQAMLLAYRTHEELPAPQRLREKA